MAQPNFSQLSLNVGYPASILMPGDPVLPGNLVNILITIRGGGGINWANQTGLNAILINVDAGGAGSLENSRKYGSSNFPNTVISKIIQLLRKKTNKPIKLGNFGLASFSGGYDTVNKILQQRSQLYYTIDNQKIKYDVNSLYMFDGMHHNIKDNPDGSPNSQMSPYIEFAKESMKDPSKKFTILHSAVKPTYASTTETSDYILKHVGLSRQPPGKQKFSSKEGEIIPKSVVNQGGFSVYQMYDTTDNKNPAAQHIAISKLMPQVFKNELSAQWNQPTEKKEVVESPSIAKNDKIDGRMQMLKRIDDFLNQFS